MISLILFFRKPGVTEEEYVLPNGPKKQLQLP
jgi:hypothetical protein